MRQTSFVRVIPLFRNPAGRLAGYDTCAGAGISDLPIAKIMRARILGLPPEGIRQHVPNP